MRYTSVVLLCLFVAIGQSAPIDERELEQKIDKKPELAVDPPKVEEKKPHDTKEKPALVGQKHRPPVAPSAGTGLNHNHGFGQQQPQSNGFPGAQPLNSDQFGQGQHPFHQNPFGQGQGAGQFPNAQNPFAQQQNPFGQQQGTPFGQHQPWHPHPLGPQAGPFGPHQHQPWHLPHPHPAVPQQNPFGQQQPGTFGQQPGSFGQQPSPFGQQQQNPWNQQQQNPFAQQQQNPFGQQQPAPFGQNPWNQQVNEPNKPWPMTGPLHGPTNGSPLGNHQPNNGGLVAPGPLGQQIQPVQPTEPMQEANENGLVQGNLGQAAPSI